MTEISLKNIVKRYAAGFEAVKGVSLDVSPGEFLVLVGPSGCGKSTLLRMIAGLEEITAGELRFNGKLMNKITAKERDIGMVFQNYALYPHLTVAENIAFPLAVRRKTSKRDIADRVKEIADMLELGGMLRRKPKELSGGQRQRVALGRALARRPQVFLFDEPLSNLDAKLRVQMRLEISRLQRQTGATGIYVTHDQTEAMTIGDRIAVLQGGKLMQIGSPKEIYDKPANRFTAGFIGSPAMNIMQGVFESRNNSLVFLSRQNELDIKINDWRYSFIKMPPCGELVELGVRPEHIMFCSKENAAFSGKIVATEFLGNETLTHFRLSANGALFCCRSLQRDTPAAGETAHFSITPDSAHFFDELGDRM